MATLLTPVYFYVTMFLNIPIGNLLKLDRGSCSEHTGFPYCLKVSNKNYFPDMIQYVMFFCTAAIHCPMNPIQWCVTCISIKCSALLCSIVTSTVKFDNAFFLAVKPAGKRESPCNHPDAKRTRVSGIVVSNNCSCMECGSPLSGCDAALYEII